MNADDTRSGPPLNNDDASAVSEQERQEALVTAYALGALDGAENAEAERLLTAPARPGARQQVAEVRAIAAALKAGIDGEPSARSAALRQAVLAAVARPEPSRRRSAGRGWMLLVGALAASLLVVITFPLRQPHKQAARERLVADARPTATPPEAGDKAPGMTREFEAAHIDTTAAETAKRLPESPAPLIAPSLAAAPAHDALAQGGNLAAPKPMIASAGEEKVARHDIDQPRQNRMRAQAAAERSAAVAENSPELPQEQPLSTLSTDVDTASAAGVRRFLESGKLPPPEAVRIEALVNSFSYDYPAPEGDVPFSVTVDAAECPWNRGHRIMRVGLRGGTTTIARDVKIGVECNPAQVASCRLLGDDTKDAVEIGAGHRMTALYDITLADERAGGGPAGSRELLTVTLRWKRPDAGASTDLSVPLTDPGPAFADAPADLRFAAAVAAFGLILHDSDQKGEASLPMVAAIAGDSLGRDEGGHRAQFLDLVRKAESLPGR